MQHIHNGSHHLSPFILTPFLPQSPVLCNGIICLNDERWGHLHPLYHLMPKMDPSLSPAAPSPFLSYLSLELCPGLVIVLSVSSFPQSHLVSSLAGLFLAAW